MPPHSLAPKKTKYLPNQAPFANVSMILIAIVIAMSPLFTRQLPLEFVPVALQYSEGPPPEGQAVLRVGEELISLNGEVVEEAELEARLKKVFKGQSKTVLFLDANPDLPYERVVSVLEIASRAGVHSVGLTPNLHEFIVQTTGIDPSAPQSAPSEIPNENTSENEQ